MCYFNVENNLHVNVLTKGFCLSLRLVLVLVALSSLTNVQAKVLQQSGPKVQYQAHVQNIGWQNVVVDGAEAGTTGRGLRLEAIKIWAPGRKITYQAHVQGIGWQTPVSDGAEAGTTGRSLRMEAIKISVDRGHVFYWVHLQNLGWRGPYRDGELAGTVGESRRLEAIKITVSDDDVPLYEHGGTAVREHQDHITVYYGNPLSSERNETFNLTDSSFKLLGANMGVRTRVFTDGQTGYTYDDGEIRVDVSRSSKNAWIDVTKYPNGVNFVAHFEARAFRGRAHLDYKITIIGERPALSPSALKATLKSTSLVALAWQNNTTLATKVLIDRRVNDGAWASLSSVAANVSVFEDKAVGPRLTYTYRTKACNNGGECTGYSDLATIRTPDEQNPLLLPPSPVAATPLADGILLRWVNNSSATIEVQRRTASLDWLPISVLGANVTEWSDKTAQMGVKYTYRLRTTEANQYSPFSSEASATAGAPVVIAKIDVGRYPNRALLTPKGEVYVTNYESNEISVIDTKSNRVVWTFVVPAQPDGITSSKDGTKIFIGHHNGFVSIINSETRILNTVKTGRAVRDLVAMPDGTAVYLAAEYEGLKKMTSDGVVTTISSQTCPEGVALTPDAKTLVVNYQCFGFAPGSNGRDSIALFDTATDKFQVALGGFPNVGAFCTTDGKQIWEHGTNACTYQNAGCPAIGNGLMNVISLEKNQLIKSLSFPGFNPKLATLLPESSLAIVGGSKLWFFDMVSLNVIRELPLAASGSLAITSDKSIAYAPLPDEGKVAVIALK